MSDATNFMTGYRTEEEQAKLLGKTVRTLRNWRKQRTGPAYTRNGKEYLYHDDWTAEWLRAGKRQPLRERRRARQRTDDHPTA
jgi:phage terminase Nu1 subunit (DNA packaging protein)